MLSSARAPDPLWDDPTARPTAEEWQNFKLSFKDYLNMITIFNPTIKMTCEQEIVFLRQYLGREGQRFFEAQNLRTKATINEVFTALDKYWGSRVNLFVTRYKFSRIRQEPAESLDAYISRLIPAVRLCEFNAVPAKKVEETFLIQQFISGLSDGRLREILLSEDANKITWERVREIARCRTDIMEQNKSFFHASSEISHVKPASAQRSKSSAMSYFRCGSNQHLANGPYCQARKGKCNKCGKLGHFARVCRSQTVSQVDTSDTDMVDSNTATSEAEHIYGISSHELTTCSAIEPKLPSSDIRTVHFCLGDRMITLPMELDSASPITIVPYEFYCTHLQSFPIQPSNYVFGSYSKNPVPILGFLNVPLFLEREFKSVVAVYVSHTNSKPLLGRNAMVSLQVTSPPDISTMARQTYKIYVGNLPPDVKTRDVESLFSKYGPIAEIDLKSRRGPPFAFIEFEDELDASDAVRGRDGYNFDGYALRVEFPRAGGGRFNGGGFNSSRRGFGRGGGGSGPSRRSEFRVVVSGLPPTGSWQDLKDHMREAGDVGYADVFRDGTGVVEFLRYEDMKYAIKRLDDSKFRSHEGESSYIRVREERPYESRSRSRSRSYGSPRRGRSYESGSRSASPIR